MIPNTKLSAGAVNRPCGSEAGACAMVSTKYSELIASGPVGIEALYPHHSYPIGSMYGIYANIGGILMVNVTIYSIHGSYGYG